MQNRSEFATVCTMIANTAQTKGWCSSWASYAHVQIPIVVDNSLEAIGDKLMLLADLANLWTLDELQGLRMAIWRR